MNHNITLDSEEVRILEVILNKTKIARDANAADEKIGNITCSITMSKSLQTKVIEKSERDDRSFSATVRVALEEYLSKPA